MEDKNRLVEILKHIGARKNTLAKELGYTNGSVFYQIETGRNGISTSLARKITNKIPRDQLRMDSNRQRNDAC